MVPGRVWAPCRSTPPAEPAALGPARRGCGDAELWLEGERAVIGTAHAERPGRARLRQALAGESCCRHLASGGVASL